MTWDSSAGPAALLSGLRADLAAISERVTTRIESDEQDYSAAALDHDELAAVVTGNIASMLDAIGGVPYSLEPARRTGRLKAERGVSLDSLLHAYRLAGLAFWEIIAERAGRADGAELSRLSTVVWATVDEYSVAAADAYRHIVAAEDERPMPRLLRALLDPGLPATRRARLCERMGLPARGAFLILVGDVRLQAPGVTTVRTVVADDRVTLVAARTLDVLDDAVRRVRSRAGASKPFDDLAAAPGALDQARLAFRCLGPDDLGVHRYASSPARALIAAHPALATDVLADTLAAFDGLRPDDADDLVRTLSAWFELAGSTAAVGQRMHLHRNTVLHRLKRVEKLTGIALAVPAEAALLYLAVQARLLGAPGNGLPS
ncbi:PucR family transcriptional regulator [Nocardia cyriacigeorgica]|uniref:PucR family transcriptional regulator n=2 Tax=Nocardia cyriacigeorgica TaxID=135487 RepID=UPI00189438D3|nr:helix-turn-helix domain-containing protein [Nocardia cyriacigeorgica]MBF6434961.1 helix-turn-helix domain-containing protein [Nocardia cyriacigeorgica]MBF6454959.1 helix-turn-helix domain-containing protein [Nocardia cyriacigeorgica]MBF6552854.1 helix-turn-helix domain-containing protein [Nocardia cyriacigeorgica]